MRKYNDKFIHVAVILKNLQQILLLCTIPCLLTAYTVVVWLQERSIFLAELSTVTEWYSCREVCGHIQIIIRTVDCNVVLLVRITLHCLQNYTKQSGIENSWIMYE